MIHQLPLPLLARLLALWPSREASAAARHDGLSDWEIMPLFVIFFCSGLLSARLSTYVLRAAAGA
jgi:hypothetical protein